MTNEARKARDEQLVAAIAVVLTSGFAVENSRGDARIECILDDESAIYHVLTLAQDGGIRPVRELFADIGEATRYYLDCCDT